MASKKNTVIVPTVDVPNEGATLAPLQSADLIDLLVEEASATLEAEVGLAQVAFNDATHAYHDADRAYTDGANEAMSVAFAPQIKALKKLFPADLCKLNSKHSSPGYEVHVCFYGPALSADEARTVRREYGAGGYTMLTDRTARTEEWRKLLAQAVLYSDTNLDVSEVPQVKELYAKRQEAYAAQDAAGKHLHAVQNQVYELRNSTKKLRTQLIRKVLGSNANGGLVLQNVRGLSAQFIASLKKSPAPC